MVALSEAKKALLKTRLDSLRLALETTGNVRRLSIQVVDLANDSKVVINPQAKYVPASLLKIPVLIAIMKYQEEKGNILDLRLQVVPYGSEDTDPNLEENESYSFDYAQTYRIRDLMEIMMAYSDNSATAALMTYIVQNKPGLIEQVEADLKGSIPVTTDLNQDIVHIDHFAGMMEALYHARYLKPENSELLLKLLNKSRYGSGVRRAIPANIPMAHKFGVRFNVSEMNPEFPVQLHQIAIIYHPTHPFVLSIMSKGNDIRHLREAMRQVAKLVYEEVDR